MTATFTDLGSQNEFLKRLESIQADQASAAAHIEHTATETAITRVNRPLSSTAKMEIHKDLKNERKKEDTIPPADPEPVPVIKEPTGAPVYYKFSLCSATYAGNSLAPSHMRNQFGKKK